MKHVKVIVADITSLQVDAIVNAANRTLLGGGGVDGAIHRAAGRRLYEECKTLGGCETGQSKITGGYDLPCKYVIHTVGPVYRNYNEHKVTELLASCYRTAMNIAKEKKMKSIAFSCISTGVYGFPKQTAAQIALSTISECITEGFDGEVIICCFDEVAKTYYDRIMLN